MNPPEAALPRRDTSRVAGLLLVTGGLAALLFFGLYLRLDRPPVALAVVVVLALFSLAAVAGLWLARLGRLAVSAGVLITGLGVAGLALTVLVAEIGVAVGLSMAVATATVAGVALDRAPARFVILGGVIGAALAMLVDLFVDALAPWQRLSLDPLARDVVVPAAAAGLILILGALNGLRFSRYRLSTKLLIGFLSAALVPLTLVSAWNDVTSRAALRTAANQSLLAAAAQTSATLDSFVGTAANTVQAAGQLPDLREVLRLAPEQRAGSAAEGRAKAALTGLPNPGLPNITAQPETRLFQAFTLLDPAGRPAVSTAPSLPPAAWLTGDLLAVPRDAGRVYLSPLLFIGPGQARLYFSAPVSDGDRVAGVLVGEVNGAWLQRIIVQSNTLLGPQAGAFALLFDEHGLRLADGAAARTNTLRYAALPEAGVLAALQSAGRVPERTAAELDAGLAGLAAAVRQARATGQAGEYAGAVHVGAEAGQPGPNHLAVLRALTSQPWVVVAAQPESVALAPARAETRNNILIGLAIGLVVAGLSALAARNLARPIRQLTWAAERIRAGDLSVRPRPMTADEIGQLTETFSSMTAQLQQTVSELEERVLARTASLQATADISRATAGIRDLDELLNLAVDLVRDRFGFYHASVFLLDEAGEYALLRASTGEIGAQLKARGHRLAVGSRSLVGWVTQNQRPRIARDVAGDPFHFQNPLLPETRSELCLPLAVGGRLLGTLDVQSRERDAFAEADVQTLQVLADQLSIAIENAQLFRAAQMDLAEARALYMRTLEANWRQALGAGPRELVFDLEPGLPPADDAGGPAEGAGPAPVSLPLRLRDRTIGVIEFQGRPGDAPLAPEEAAVLETIAAQLSTALESAALIQESQARSRRDQLITAITDEMRSTLNPAVILQTGIRQLGRALGGAEVTVRLQPPLRPGRPEGKDER